MSARVLSTSALAVTLVFAGCGHETIELGAPLEDAGGAADAQGTNLPSSGDGAVCEASAACLGLGALCGGDADCCTARCVAGACLPSGACVAPTGACAARADCCSGDCEPIGANGALVCTAACRPDGAGSACQRASDCCGLDCNGGTCGGAECAREGTDCATNAQCCSGVCDPQEQKCTLGAGACRPAGEDCSSGGGAPCCATCDGTTRRCDVGAGPCRLPSALCTQTSDCCSGTCAADATGKLVCGGSLLTNGATCQAGFACASGACVGNPPRCDTPGAVGCAAPP